MSLRKSLGITAVLAIAILSFSHSCITIDNDLGSSLIPDDQILKIYIADIELPVRMEVADTIQSDSYSMILGTIYDDDFGKISVSSAVGLYIASTDTIDFGIDPVFKRAYIEMSIDSTVVLSDDQNGITQNVRLYELTRSLDTTTLYNNSLKRSDYSEKPINSNISITTGSSIYIEIKEEFAKKIINTPQEILDSAELFNKYHKGLYFTMDQPLTEYGGRLNYITCSSQYLRLEMVYNDPSKELYDRDTTFYIRLGSYELSSSYPKALNIFEDQVLNIDPTDVGEKIYVSPFNGIKPYIDAHDLRLALDNWAENNSVDLSKIVIARASLEFPFDENTDYLKLNRFPKSLYPCVRSILSDSVIFYMPLDEVYNTSTSQGYIDRSLSFYKPDITTYISNFIKKEDTKIDHYDNIWMIPIESYSDSYSGTVYYNIAYDMYYKGILNGTTSDRRPKLKITYSILN